MIHVPFCRIENFLSLSLSLSLSLVVLLLYFVKKVNLNELKDTIIHKDHVSGTEIND